MFFKKYDPNIMTQNPRPTTIDPTTNIFNIQDPNNRSKARDPQPMIPIKDMKTKTRYVKAARF